MNQEQAAQLLSKYNEGNCTDEEQAIVEQWYVQLPYEARAPDAEQVMAAMQQVWNALPQKVADKKKFLLWPKIAAAAAALAAITFGVWLYDANHTHRHTEPVSGSLYANDIVPGSNKATLTFASGKVITLDTNKTSVVVADSVKAMTMLTAATPRGGMYQVTLSDGTRVWLNADSKISFPSRFSGKERKILLTGEAYFEVMKDKQHPFIVSVNNQQVKVLGTHFNVNGYKDEAWTVTTLLEGSVRVDTKLDSKILKPGQQSVGDIRGLKVSEVDVNAVVDWKDGDFVFKNESLEQIMKRVARWYNIEVIYGRHIDKQQEFGGKVSRLKNISEVLKIMQSTGQVKFKIEGRRVYVE